MPGLWRAVLGGGLRTVVGVLRWGEIRSREADIIRALRLATAFERDDVSTTEGLERLAAARAGLDALERVPPATTPVPAGAARVAGRRRDR